jgi:hypothetical protein
MKQHEGEATHKELIMQMELYTLRRKHLQFCRARKENILGS